ncbi:unnamed protein product [Psylliodes chrysocephalus]|uniref:Uncharacterized protein n=1 Tax=Psylliodes chrysocephalus TaxID=3402493 RepID=A0A9P0CPZ3_9CUCU|nr:unnamed protein product [Psylliodes chrysocephala]
MLAINLTSVCFVVTILVSNVSSYGEYVPKSIFLIDELGQITNEYKVRSRRDLENVILRFRRSPGNSQGGGSANSYSGSYSHSGADGGSSYIPDFSNFAANFPSNLEDIQRQAESFANVHGRSGGAPLPEDLGYRGPILFSRSGVGKGTGVKVSGAAQGPRGAFSSSSSSVDDQGNVKYDVKSGKY